VNKKRQMAEDRRKKGFVPISIALSRLAAGKERSQIPTERNIRA